MLDVKLLIVDDNETDVLLFDESIEYVKEYLQTKDIIVSFEVDKCQNGEEALKILDKNEYDIIFIDIKMPKMDGIELLKNIRDKKIKGFIIIFTTSDYEKDIFESYKLKANGYLLKSLEIMEFEENLKSIMMFFIQDNFVYLNAIKPRFQNYIKT
jgi:DNA-binding NarL/FixJ family response regulator